MKFAIATLVALLMVGTTFAQAPTKPAKPARPAMPAMPKPTQSQSVLPPKTKSSRSRPWKD